jgi:hypothetical protein
MHQACPREHGALYVTWDNYNNTVTGSDNRNQILLAKSTNGGASFGAPVKVGDYYDLPDCATYQGGQDAGRACVPEKSPTANSGSGWCSPRLASWWFLTMTVNMVTTR